MFRSESAPPTIPLGVPTPPQKRPMSCWVIGLIGVGGVFVLGFCAILAIGVLTLLGGRVDKQFADSQGRFQVTAPGDWSNIPQLNDTADITVGNPRKEQYLISFAEPLEELEGIDRDLYGRLSLEQMQSVVEGFEVQPARVYRIGSSPAIQYEFSGTVDGVRVVYWLTVIEGKEHMYRLIAWTIIEKVDDNRDLLQKVVNSFVETNS